MPKLADFAHEIWHEDVTQGGSGNLVLKEDEQHFPDLILLSPLGLFVLAIYMRNYSTLSVGLGHRLGRHNDDRESRAPPWPPLVAR